MATYGYRCEKNGHEFEVVQGFSDPPLQRCPQCRSKVRRIFYPVGIAFKGPGFYATDNRSRGSTSSSSGDSGSETKTGDTAAAKTKTSKTDSGSEAKEKKTA